MTVRAKLIPVAVACGMAGTLVAQESQAHELSLLEFLGSWEEEDDLWIIVDGLLDDGYEVEVDANVLEDEGTRVADGADDADVAVAANDADGAEVTDESGESNDVDGRDEVAAADAD